MTEQLTTTNILSLFQTNKSERQSFVTDVIERLESGEADPIKVHAQCKKMEDIVKALTGNEIYKSVLIEAVERNGKKFNSYDAEFSVKEAGVKYDYSQCNDDQINQLQKDADDLAEVIKSRQSFLKTIPANGIDIITLDGEGVRIYPPSKTSTTVVNTILK